LTQSQVFFFHFSGDFSVKDPDEVNLDEPITWVAPTLTFICPWLQ
jgi:hypothetical protein